MNFIIIFTIFGFLPSSLAQFPLLPLPEGTVMRLGKGWSTEIDYSPDGTHLAVGSSKGIWIYDVHTGKELKLLTGHLDAVLSVSYSPNGKFLASGGQDLNVTLCNSTTQESITLSLVTRIGFVV
ncbi:hypothetical protein F4212_07545 [Candidatus Poribacteria bacterium]|nr:hypothetical protein [Candidatus Poribacteria bacterium]